MGWVYVSCHDRGKRDGVCQLCGALLRYEHIVKDPYGWKMVIGCECADKVLNERDVENVVTQDKKMKSKVRKDQKNEILYQKYLARCAAWNEKYPDNPCTIKTKEEIYG